MNKAFLLIFIWSFSINIGIAQPNKSHVIDSVSNLASVNSPANGMEVVCNCDSMIHCYNNGAWHTEFDSAHTKRMATTSYSAGTGLVLNTSTFSVDSTAYVQQFNASGKISHPLKMWTGTVTPTTANGFSIDISAAGFTSVTSAQIQPIFNSSTASAMPLITTKSQSNTAIVVNLLQSNSTTISILGVNVVGLQFLQSLTGVTISCTVFGY